MKRLLKAILFLLVLPVVFPEPALQAQTSTDTDSSKGFLVPADRNGIPIFTYPVVQVYGKKLTAAELREHRRRVREYEKLRRNIQIVYPLAVACSDVIQKVNRDLDGETNPAKRKKYLKQLETEMFDRYEKQLKGLTLTQGKLLIKLIDRQCGENAFLLIDEYRSWRSAAFWQLVANFFGASLKSEYDPQKEPAIETIVREIESGKDGSYKVDYH